MRALGRGADCEVSVRADLAMTGYRGRRIGGGLRAARPTGGLQEVRWGGDTRACHPTRTFVGQGPCALPWVRERNPPVSALPCQPPLGKGALGTGVRIATTSDMGFCKRCSFVRRKYHDSI